MPEPAFPVTLSYAFRCGINPSLLPTGLILSPVVGSQRAGPCIALDKLELQLRHSALSGGGDHFPEHRRSDAEIPILSDDSDRNAGAMAEFDPVMKGNLTSARDPADRFIRRFRGHGADRAVPEPFGSLPGDGLRLSYQSVNIFFGFN